MALSATNKAILNAFADSQPALRVPGKDLANSNIKLGDIIADAGTLQTAATTAYSPSPTGNWASTPPATIAAALDRMATLVKSLNSNTAIP